MKSLPIQSANVEFTQKVKAVIIYSLLVAASFFFSSCGTYYVPSTQNVPLFEEKNQGIVMGGLALGDRSSGFDLQGAYSITDNLAIAGSGFFGSVAQDYYSNGSTIYSTSNNYFNGEVSLGYFMKLGDSRGIFEVYGGGGYGGATWDIKEINKLYQFPHFFVQPNIGGHLGPVDIAFSTRVNYGVWSKFTELFIEPALTFRVGWESFKFQIQIATSFSAYYQEDFQPRFDPSYVPYNNQLGYAETFHTSWGIFIPIGFH